MLWFDDSVATYNTVYKKAHDSNCTDPIPQNILLPDPIRCNGPSIGNLCRNCPFLLLHGLLC